MFCTVVAEFLLTSTSRSPSAIAEPLILNTGARTAQADRDLDFCAIQMPLLTYLLTHSRAVSRSVRHDWSSPLTTVNRRSIIAAGGVSRDRFRSSDRETDRQTDRLTRSSCLRLTDLALQRQRRRQSGLCRHISVTALNCVPSPVRPYVSSPCILLLLLPSEEVRLQTVKDGRTVRKNVTHIST